MTNKFLHIKENCKICKGMGYIWNGARAYRGEEEVDPIQCECLKKMMLYMNLDAANIPREYFDLTIDDFNTRIKEKAILKTKIQKIIDDPASFLNEGRNLFFFGPNGTGKTMLSIEILKAALNKKKTIYYDFYPIIFELFNRKGFEANKVSDKYDEIFANTDFLVLDEIGKEMELSGATQSASRRLLEIHILKKRGDKSTILISNLEKMEDFNRVYDKHVASLLKRKYDFLEVRDEDYRGEL